MNVIDLITKLPEGALSGYSMGLRRTLPTWGTIRANLRLLYYKCFLWRKHPPSRTVVCDTYDPEAYYIGRTYPFPDLSHIQYDENLHLNAKQTLDKIAAQLYSEFTDYQI